MMLDEGVHHIKATWLRRYQAIDQLLICQNAGGGILQAQIRDPAGNGESCICAGMAQVQHASLRAEPKVAETSDLPVLCQLKGLEELEETPGTAQGTRVFVQHHSSAHAVTTAQGKVKRALHPVFPYFVSQVPLVVAEGTDPVVVTLPATLRFVHLHSMPTNSGNKVGERCAPIMAHKESTCCGPTSSAKDNRRLRVSGKTMLGQM
eukprot:CAMPEP_0115074150 /NCGR_PEP_ID=MMETSP0227-20121206/15188_1 /TAXON_ID=89957 /ORGANISM="Polarella glacialis, Strain CCMP 1383" /LENGTH=205 /DNA_ID=CAMNT_0002461101 /DNA_START=47 /DNA_END=665 /DNA_ORIENTATION=-